MNYSLITKFMGPTCGPMGPTGPRWAPCWPHELCYLGWWLNDAYIRHQDIWILWIFPLTFVYIGGGGGGGGGGGLCKCSIVMCAIFRVHTLLATGEEYFVFGTYMCYFCVARKIFNAHVGWYGDIFWFNPNIQNLVLWLTLALTSPNAIRITWTTFWPWMPRCSSASTNLRPQEHLTYSMLRIH